MLEILVGPIASGKSTYAQKRAKEGAIIVNDDAITTMLHGGDYLLYQKDLKPLYKAVENTIIQHALTLGKTVVIDRPNNTKTTRMRYIGLAKSLDSQVVVTVFPDEGMKVHAARRYNTDSRYYTLEQWKGVYQRHQSLYDEPDLYGEHLDDIIFLS